LQLRAPAPRKYNLHNPQHPGPLIQKRVLVIHLLKTYLNK